MKPLKKPLVLVFSFIYSLQLGKDKILETIMKYFSLLFIASLLLPLSSPAQLDLTRSNSECVCNTSVNDVFEEPQAFNFGKFSGQCIDSCRFRSVKILSEEKLQTKNSVLDTRTLDVVNILHFGKFYKSRIYLEDIQNVEAGFEEFRPGIHHVFLRFNLKISAPSLKLISQSDSKMKPIEIRSLVLSPEGVPPKNHKYDLFESYFGVYLLVHKLTSGDEMDRWIKSQSHLVKFYTFKTQPEVAAKVLKRGISESQRLGIQNVYQLFSNNCSTSTLHIVDAEIGKISSPSMWSKLEDALPISGPIGTLRALKNRNLVESQSL